MLVGLHSFAPPPTCTHMCSYMCDHHSPGHTPNRRKSTHCSSAIQRELRVTVSVNNHILTACWDEMIVFPSGVLRLPSEVLSWRCCLLSSTLFSHLYGHHPMVISVSVAHHLPRAAHKVPVSSLPPLCGNIFLVPLQQAGNCRQQRNCPRHWPWCCSTVSSLSLSGVHSVSFEQSLVCVSQSALLSLLLCLLLCNPRWPEDVNSPFSQF